MTPLQIKTIISLRLDDARKAFEQGNVIPLILIGVDQTGNITYYLTDDKLTATDYIQIIDMVRATMLQLQTKNEKT